MCMQHMLPCLFCHAPTKVQNKPLMGAFVPCVMKDF